MSKQIDALKLALEALEESKTNNDTMEFHDRKNKAITAIKEALAQPEQEPVAWLYTLEYGHHVANTLVSEVQRNYPFGVCGADYLAKNDDGISYVRQTPLHTADQLAAVVLREQEPVMFGLQAANGRYGNCAYSCKSHAETAAFENPAKIGYKVIGYYTTPPKRQPLTDGDIWDLHIKMSAALNCKLSDLTELTRAVEAAHGITE